MLGPLSTFILFSTCMIVGVAWRNWCDKGRIRTVPFRNYRTTPGLAPVQLPARTVTKLMAIITAPTPRDDACCGNGCVHCPFRN